MKEEYALPLGRAEVMERRQAGDTVRREASRGVSFRGVGGSKAVVAMTALHLAALAAGLAVGGRSFSRRAAAEA